MFSSQKPYYTNVYDVPRSLQSWVSTIQTVVLTADVFSVHKNHILRLCMMCVWCTTQLAKLSFNHSNGRTHSWRFWLNLRYNCWYKISFARVLPGMFYPYEGYRSVTPLDAARVNRTIFHNHCVHWYYITLIEGRDYNKHDIITPEYMTWSTKPA